MKFDGLYMGIAELNAKQSHCNRTKTGALIVYNDRLVSAGWNGTPPGDDNKCQDENNVTKPEVVHAEMNAILKAARDGVSVNGATMYVTLSPCSRCARAMIVSGIKRVVYRDAYRDSEGVDYLKTRGVDVLQWGGE